MNDLEHCVTTNSVEETLALGRRLGEGVTPGACIGLTGALGAGKTQLVKGVAEGVGVADPAAVNSPTFVIVNEYAGRLAVYHVDVYRLAGEEELIAVGFEEMLHAGGLVIVEWADRVESSLPDDRVSIHLEHVAETVRGIRLVARGDRSRKIMGALGDDLRAS